MKAMHAKESIGVTARHAILLYATDQEALELVRKRHPNANTTLNCIRWYRKELRHNDFLVPKSSEAHWVRVLG